MGGFCTCTNVQKRFCTCTNVQKIDFVHVQIYKMMYTFYSPRLKCVSRYRSSYQTRSYNKVQHGAELCYRVLYVFAMRNESTMVKSKKIRSCIIVLHCNA